MRFTIGCVLISLTLIVVLSRAEWACQKDVSYKENECNECTCTDSLQLKCGDKGCLDRIESVLFNCKVGTVTKRDCNVCECVKDLGTVCTNNECK